MKVDPLDHKGLVYYVVRKMKCKNKEDFDDMVQCGFLGLIKAAQKFDHNYGVKFSTYAVKAILSHIYKHHFTQQETITVPVHSLYKNSKFRKYVKQTKNTTYINSDRHWEEKDKHNTSTTIADVELKDTLRLFSKKHQTIIRMRMEGYTLKEVGEKLGFSGRRAYQYIAEQIRPKLKKILSLDESYV